MKYIALLLLCVVVAGCGGGGGSSVAPIDSTVRAYQPGDQWEYDVTGTVSDGVDTVGISGTYTETVTSQTVVTPQSVTAQIVTTDWNLSGNGNTIMAADKAYLTQDTDGTIWKHGGEDGGTVWWVSVPTAGRYECLRSPLSQGESWGATVERTTGETLDELYTVVGTETVSVPAGSFDTYKISVSGKIGGYPATGTEWYAPQAGTMIKAVYVATDTDQGLTLRLTAVLSDRSRSPL
jgi:hypothetical protein